MLMCVCTRVYVCACVLTRAELFWSDKVTTRDARSRRPLLRVKRRARLAPPETAAAACSGEERCYLAPAFTCRQENDRIARPA